MNEYEGAKLGQPQGGLGSPRPEPEAVEPVVFQRSHDVYQAGETAHFPASVAADLIAAGIAKALGGPPADRMVRERRTVRK